jgi:hypothetical protein
VDKVEDILEMDIFFGEHLDIPALDNWDPEDQSIPPDIIQVGSTPCVIPESGIWKVQTRDTMTFRGCPDLGWNETVKFVPRLSESSPVGSLLRAMGDGVMQRELLIRVGHHPWAEGPTRSFFPAGSNPRGIGATVYGGVKCFDAKTTVGDRVIHELLFVEIGGGSWMAKSRKPVDIDDLDFESFVWMDKGDVVRADSGCSLVRSWSTEWILGNQNRVHEWFRSVLHGTDRIGTRISLLAKALKHLGAISRDGAVPEELFTSSLDKVVRHLSAHNPWYLAMMLSGSRTGIDTGVRKTSDGTPYASHPYILER